MSKCYLCPRSCGAERKNSAGFCAVNEKVSVVRAAAHFGEEPCISARNGSGTVFFAGCNLRCVFCQNHEISAGQTGRLLDDDELSNLFLRLEAQGVHNINLVTPTHYSDIIARALKRAKLKIPVVWNSSGYESVSTLKSLEGLVQIYLPDFKYAQKSLARDYSAAEDYPETALAAIKEMLRQTGAFVLDEDGIMQGGVLIRHMILPGSAENTLRVIDMIEDNFPPESIMFSLMAQYTPMPATKNHPLLCRGITRQEFDRCLSYLDFSGLKAGYVQELSSATDEMIPAFDGTGV